MRVTNQMLNENARQSGLPINSVSLLDYIKSDSKKSPLAGVLNLNKEMVTNSTQKGSYERLNQEAEHLGQSSQNLLQEGEKSLFEQAEITGDNQKVYDNIENLFKGYNSTLKALRSASSTMNDFYKNMLLEATKEAKEELAGVGVTFAKDGTASVDVNKVKTSDNATLEALFGKESTFVNKIKILSTRISDNAEANVESLSGSYNANGNIYATMASSKFDFWG